MEPVGIEPGALPGGGLPCRKATGDERLRERIDTLVTGLLECQKGSGDGSLSVLQAQMISGNGSFPGISGPVSSVSTIAAPSFCVYHKIFDGLLHVFRATGDARALRMAARFAGWVEFAFRQPGAGLPAGFTVSAWSDRIPNDRWQTTSLLKIETR